MKDNLRGMLAACALATAAALSGCTVYGPTRPGSPSGSQPSSQRSGVIEQPQPGQQPVAPLQGTPAQPGMSVPRHFQLSPPAAALVSMAQGQEHSGHYGLAAQTLERALSIEPRNPLVWIALGRESLSAGSPAQAYGMARKALYLANGAPHAQATAWGLIAAALRAQGRNQAAVAAEQKAAELYPP